MRGRFLEPPGRPFGLPDRPGWNRLCAGGLRYPTSYVCVPGRAASARCLSFSLVMPLSRVRRGWRPLRYSHFVVRFTGAVFRIPELIVLNDLLSASLTFGGQALGKIALNNIVGARVCRRIKDVLHKFRLIFGTRSERDKLHCVLDVLGSLQDHPVVVLEHTLVPGEADFGTVSICRRDTPIPGATSGNDLVNDKLRAFRSALPPFDDVRLDPIKTLERTIPIEGIQILRIHPVGHKRGFKGCPIWPCRQRALAGKSFHVPDIGPGGGTGVAEPRAVICDQQRIDNVRDAVLAERDRVEVVLVGIFEPAIVNREQQTLFGEGGGDSSGKDRQIVSGGSGQYTRAHPRVAPRSGNYLDPGLLRERLEVGPFLCFTPRAASVKDDDFPTAFHLLCNGGSGKQQA